MVVCLAFAIWLSQYVTPPQQPQEVPIPVATTPAHTKTPPAPEQMEQIFQQCLRKLNISPDPNHRMSPLEIQQQMNCVLWELQDTR
jgi:hypothetical protein